MRGKLPSQDEKINNEVITSKPEKETKKLVKEDTVTSKSSKELKDSDTVKKPTKEIRQFSGTVFTDGDKREVNRYKKFHMRINKKGLIDTSKVTRYKPTTANGLTDEQAQLRMNQGLSNYTHRGSTKTIGRILFTNIFTAFNILCFCCCALLIWVQDWWSTSFMLIVTVNMLIGIFQEIRAKITIEKLSLVSASRIKTIRSGEKREILIDDVVLDDVIILSNGQQIPADSIVLDGMIEANESLLTGESVPIAKQKGDTVLAGSFVVSGTCLARVDKISQESYVQTLAQGATRYVRPKSELFNSLRMIIKVISVIMVILCTLYIIREFAKLPENVDAALRQKTVSAAVAAIIGMIPSGMFLLTTLALAVGVINLAKSRTLVQELYCIEMLARVDTLCLDKTGTITNGSMKVSDVVEIKNTSNYTIREIVASMVFALDDNNQTSIALQDHFGSQVILKAQKTMPFSSSRKLSAVSFQDEGTYILGAPEFVLKEPNERVDERVKRFASQGYRVLCLARAPGQLKDGKIPDGGKPIALITLQDQVRPEAPETLEWFKQNGVDIRVISGDNAITVSEVAKRAGVVGAEKYISLEGMSPIEVRNVARDYTVFGRVSPEQKLILIKELKNQGRTVAMTGDGVNDILALREADCSIAMAAGAEAARNVSHLVLLDSNFASMPKVVAQGRRVVNNIQKTSSIYLFKTIFVMLLVIFCIAVGQTYPFRAINMTLLEFFVIGIPSFALALEINDQKIKGKFLLTVLRNSFSGAFVVILNVIILYLFKEFGLFGITLNSIEYTTMLIFTVTITGLFMLWKIALPLNLYRTCLMILMTVMIFVVGYYGSGIIGSHIDQLGTTHVMLLIIILLASYPLIALVNNTLAKIRLDKIPIINKLNNNTPKETTS